MILVNQSPRAKREAQGILVNRSLERSERLKRSWSTNHLERSERLKKYWSINHLERSERLKGSWSTNKLKQSERLKRSLSTFYVLVKEFLFPVSEYCLVITSIFRERSRKNGFRFEDSFPTKSMKKDKAEKNFCQQIC